MVTYCWILLTMRNFSDKFWKQNQNAIFYSIDFFWISCRLWDNVEICGTARQVTGKKKMRHRKMWFACRITKATDTFLKYLYLLIFHGKNGYANAAPQKLGYTFITCIFVNTFYTGWHKKRELLKNPTKIEEIQEKKILTEIEHYNLPFKRQ